MGSIPKANDTFYWRNPETGLIELIDCLTGETLARQKAPDEELHEVRSRPGRYLYNEVTANLIANEVANGKTLPQLCREDRFPNYDIVRQWMVRVPEFAALIEQAKADRAEIWFDKAIKEVEEAYAKDESPRKKVLTDFYKYAAQLDNPKGYTPGTKQEQHVTSTKIVIETGIRRDDDPGFHKDETKDVTPRQIDATDTDK